MNHLFWYGIWGILFATCSVLGLVTDTSGVLGVLMELLALAFYVPPVILLVQGHRTGNRKTLRTIRNISALSLLATLGLMIANIVLALRVSEGLGNVLHILVVIVSSPMSCMGNGLVSLFLWACLLIVGIRCSRKKK